MISPAALGLVLAERLAEEVGWYATGAGKQVWATFALGGRPGPP
ncbi:ATP-binding protein [Actinoplanes siamensis]|uniref:Uncharacterized protein n=1 Tax=Actinoplanes siamensis TaxID=1223317 RepID=A0A919N9H3_9ACTN|nr:hypothetical protein [Actinoplanes siamensis]GIF06926.1 hypothetical protein Asi03nite_44640 [Actinoplanes siamensis]